jgi:hypothetical protein
MPSKDVIAISRFMMNGSRVTHAGVMRPNSALGKLRMTTAMMRSTAGSLKHNHTFIFVARAIGWMRMNATNLPHVPITMCLSSVTQLASIVTCIMNCCPSASKWDAAIAVSLGLVSSACAVLRKAGSEEDDLNKTSLAVRPELFKVVGSANLILG